MGVSRRQFVASAVAAGVARGAAGPGLAVAHYKHAATTPEAIAEEARRLTRAAIDGLGGMGRFVSRGNAVWVKPNMGWDRRPEQAATSNPDVVATIVELCYQAGAGRVTVGAELRAQRHPGGGAKGRRAVLLPGRAQIPPHGHPRPHPQGVGNL
jgi:hypothetical protein